LSRWIWRLGGAVSTAARSRECGSIGGCVNIGSSMASFAGGNSTGVNATCGGPYEMVLGERSPVYGHQGPPVHVTFIDTLGPRQKKMTMGVGQWRSPCNEKCKVNGEWSEDDPSPPSTSAVTTTSSQHVRVLPQLGNEARIGIGVSAFGFDVRYGLLW